MLEIPAEAYVVLATGLTTIMTTILTQIFVMRSELKKNEREESRENRRKQNEWESKQREIKASKLADLWLALDLAKERIADAQIQCQIESDAFLPPAKDLATNATGMAYGIAILHFPELRALVYALHVQTTKCEAGLWFHKIEDVDSALNRINEIRTNLADAIETTAENIRYAEFLPLS
nr:hypothetical protein [uncultured Pseudogulbenkiania sp.]